MKLIIALHKLAVSPVLMVLSPPLIPQRSPSRSCPMPNPCLGHQADPLMSPGDPLLLPGHHGGILGGGGADSPIGAGFKAPGSHQDSW